MKIQELTTASGRIIKLPPHLATFGNRLSTTFDPPAPHRLRLFLYGYPGSGKTSFASSIPNAVIIDPEDSGCFSTDPESPRFVPRGGEDIEKFVAALCEDGATPAINHVVFDTIDKVIEMAIPWLTEKLNREEQSKTSPRVISDVRVSGKDGAGWGKINEWVNNLRNNLYAAGFGWTVCSHVKEDTQDMPGGEKKLVIRAAPNDGVRIPVLRDAQYVLFTYSQEGKRLKPAKMASGATRPAYESYRGFHVDVVSQAGTADARIMKDRLGKFIAQSFEVTDKSGWNEWVQVYTKAVDGARASLAEPQGEVK